MMNFVFFFSASLFRLSEFKIIVELQFLKKLHLKRFNKIILSKLHSSPLKDL